MSSYEETGNCLAYQTCSYASIFHAISSIMLHSTHKSLLCTYPQAKTFPILMKLSDSKFVTFHDSSLSV